MKLVVLWLFLLTLATSPQLASAAEPTPVPNFDLVTHEGKPVQLYDYKGKYVLLSFVFTRCPMPNMCPLNMSLSKELIEKWKAQPYLRRKGYPLHILAVTLDPEYDTPKVMREYMASRGLDTEYFTFLTGTPEKLSELASEFNIIGVPGGGTISHNMKTALLNPLMIPIAEYKDNEWTPDQILELIPKATRWWGWFFVLSSLLAIPGIILVMRMRRHAPEASPR